MTLFLTLCLSIMTVVPRNTILVKGATPGTSDSTTPLPEQGTVAGGQYHNAYFGLSYPIPAGWSEQPAGPPPSDGGSYVLAQFATARANVLVAAQDLFFGRHPLAAGPGFEIERGPEDVTISGRTFHRLAWGAPGTGLHWRAFSTEVRCHALTFTFTGTDVAALDAAEQAMSRVALAPAGPACVRDYAEVVERREPEMTTHRFNTIPVRVIVDAKGRVTHVHLLSAFPDQSQAIITALRTWRFKPYRRDGKAVPVETGLVFGVGPHSPRINPSS